MDLIFPSTFGEAPAKATSKGTKVMFWFIGYNFLKLFFFVLKNKYNKENSKNTFGLFFLNKTI